MTKSFERVIIYLTYGFLISLAILFVAAKANAWEMKHDYKTPLTKVCKDCLVEFAECMENADKAAEEAGKEDPLDPQRYVNWKLSCVKRAAACTETNKCGTKIVLDEK